MHLLALQNADLKFAQQIIADELNFYLYPNDKACLIGANGTGKSSLLKILAGIYEIDSGELFKLPHMEIRYLQQSLSLPSNETALSYVRKFCDADYKAEAVLQGLKIPNNKSTDQLSGGEARRILLAATIVGEPDVLLLDEPTNHLDIDSIQWLEQYLKNFSGTYLLISHDRAFLENTTQKCFFLANGQLDMLQKSYVFFDEWMEEKQTAAAKIEQKLKTHLKQELHWLQRGVTARRKRNQGRLEKLNKLRETKKEILGQKKGQVSFSTAEKKKGSNVIIEAENITCHFGNTFSLQPFSTRIMRNDRIGIVGPNGAGKTTLVNILTERLAPNSGSVKLGENITIAQFDQRRDDMDDSITPRQYLCPQGGDQIYVKDRYKHVVGYLKEFLFNEHQANGNIGLLSGGEKNRLALAKAFAIPSNVCILDEPTNDLDLETLDLLEETLADYPGTLIIISHDRKFLDHLVNSVIAIESDGSISEHIGGYTDYLKKKKQQKTEAKKTSPAKTATNQIETGEHKKNSTKRLPYHLKRRLDQLPTEIEKLQQHIHTLEASLANPTLYREDQEKFAKLSINHASSTEKLDLLELEYLEILEQQESM